MYWQNMHGALDKGQQRCLPASYRHAPVCCCLLQVPVGGRFQVLVLVLQVTLTVPGL
jgi:hypothetical protein